MNAFRVQTPFWLLLMFCAGFLLFPSAGRDDVHISYWAAHALADLGGIFNYNGASLEQSSSLLHVLILAALNRLSGLSVVDIGGSLSVMFGLLAMLETARLGRRMGIEFNSLSLVILVGTPPFVYWAFGAMETTLVAWLLTFFVRSLIDWQVSGSMGHALQSIAAACLYLLARPEAVLVISAFLLACIGLSLITHGKLKHLLLLQVILLTGFALLAWWRWSTFGSLFPQPVSAKVSASLLLQIKHGIRYLVYACLQSPLLLLLLGGSTLAGLNLLRKGDYSPSRVFPLLLAGSQIGFVVTSGGDWMEGARFVVPVLPLLVLSSTALLEKWWLAARPQMVRPVIMILSLLGLTQLLYFASYYSTSVPLWQYADFVEEARQQGVRPESYSRFEIANRVHLRDAIFIEHLDHHIKRLLQTQDEVVIVSAQAGMVPFHIFQRYYGQLRFIDLAGLATQDFTGCSVLQDLHTMRGSAGVGMSHQFYLDNITALHEECGVAYPDLLYDVDNNAMRRTALFEDSEDFELLYVQQTQVCPSGLRCAPSVEGNMFLAAPSVKFRQRFRR